jgi:hypothetical protein
MSWIAEYDTQGREFPTCVHVTKTTGTMTNGATYVPIEDGKAVRAENAKLRELAAGIGHLLFALDVDYCAGCPRDDINHPCPVYTVKGGECLYETDLRDLGVEVDE